ncbi:MAG TPA: fluoride efflux transporter CrcB [Actinospica sp.]|jgi:CrcB protein|nr:fluoride efflux transporter CrcB [Actinospica sp.]
MLLALLVGLAAAVGALARYLLDQAVAQKFESAFPWGTWVINVSGSFVLGLITGLSLHDGLSPHVVTVLGTGICGGYTTFSTFNFETIRLAEDGSLVGAVGNIAGSIAAGLLAAGAGLGLALL